MDSSRSGGRSIVPGRRAVAWLSTLAVATAALAGTTLLGRGSTAERLALGAGSVWVASPAEGLLTLIDGASEEVVASARVRGAGHDLGVVQAGTDAYVTDSTDGAVARIDGATFDVSDPVPFASAGGGVQVLSGGGELYVLDPAGARARLVDPRALQVRTDLSLAATPGPGQSVVDDAGRLWLIDEVNGGLTWFDAHKHVLRDVAGPDDRLVLVQGRPVLVDTARSLVHTLDAAGRPAVESCLDVRDDDVRLLGSATGAELYAAQSATGSFVTAAVGRDDCEQVVELAEPGAADFGELVQSGPFVFVPDRASGRASVVDTRDGEVTPIDLVDPGHDVELVAEGGFVFYNDRDGERAGVLSLADGVWSVSEALQKFDPGTGEPPPAPTPSEPAPDAAPPAEQPPADAAVPQAPPTTTPPPVARQAAPPASGGRPTGRSAPAPASSTAPPPPVLPTVGPITVTPAVPMLGEPATFTATADQADGATWAWSIAAGAGAPFATGADAGSFTPTLPSDQGLAFVVTLTVTTAAGAQSAAPLAVTATPSTVPVISSVTTSESVYYPYTDATFTAVHSDVPPGGSLAWSITRDGAPFEGPVAGTPGVPYATSVGEPGLYRVTLTITVDGRSASGSADFKVEYVCGPSLSPDVIDLRAATSAVVTVTSDCVGTNVFEVAVAPWLSGPASVTVPQGGSGTITVVRSTGQPPSDGDHQDAVVVTYRSGSLGVMEGRATVQANRSPDMSFPADVCRDMGDFGMAFFARVSDDSIDSVTLSINGASYSMDLIGPPDGYREVVDKALLGSATTWRITAVDTNGLASTLDGTSPCW